MAGLTLKRKGNKMTNQEINTKLDEMKKEYGIEHQDYDFTEGMTNTEIMEVICEREQEMIECIQDDEEITGVSVTEEQRETYRPVTYSKRVMVAMAKALGYTYQEAKDINGKEDKLGYTLWRKEINGVQKASNKALFNHFMDELILRGDKEVLRQARYADGLYIWNEL